MYDIFISPLKIMLLSELLSKLQLYITLLDCLKGKNSYILYLESVHVGFAWKAAVCFYEGVRKCL